LSSHAKPYFELPKNLTAGKNPTADEDPIAGQGPYGPVRHAKRSEVVHTLSIANLDWQKHWQREGQHPLKEPVMNAIFFASLVCTVESSIAKVRQ
jgi:hypothetical protein